MKATVQYYKYPRTPHWHYVMSRLGEDRHGVWLGSPIGSVVQRGEEPPVTTQRSFVQVIPSTGWWTAIFNDPIEPRLEVYVDVVTAPSWVAPDRVEMVDLDLDVIRLRSGGVYIDDEDEFSQHQVDLGYSEHMISAARSTAARLVLDLENRVPPFDDTPHHWLDLLA